MKKYSIRYKSGIVSPKNATHDSCDFDADSVEANGEFVSLFNASDGVVYVVRTSEIIDVRRL